MKRITKEADAGAPQEEEGDVNIDLINHFKTGRDNAEVQNVILGGEVRKLRKKVEELTARLAEVEADKKEKH